MNGDAADNFTQRLRFLRASPGTDDGEHDVAGTGCFGYLRGARDRAPMLELRKRNGDVLAVGYAWLDCAQFSPSDGIVLQFTGHRVHIVGQQLNTATNGNASLFEALVKHRALWIQEVRLVPVGAVLGGSGLVELIQW